MQSKDGCSLIDLFVRTAARLPGNVALRQWTPRGREAVTWKQYVRATEHVAAGLLALGLKPGERVGIWTRNCPQWLFFDLGAMRMGGVTVPIYDSLIASQAEHVIADSQMAVLLVETAAQASAIQAMRARCPHLRHIIGLTPCSDIDVAWDTLMRLGQTHRATHHEAVMSAETAVHADTLATVVYTSGTTGPAKGAMLTHRNLVFEAELLTGLLDLRPREETLSFLPLCHIAERLQGEVVAVRWGLTVNFGRGIHHVAEDLRAVRPTLLVAVPRVWEKMRDGIMAQVARGSLFQQGLFDWALQAGRRRFAAQVANRRLSPRHWLEAQAADRLVGAVVRKRLGLDRMHFLASGAAPLAPGVLEFFAALGMPIMEAYGQTECTGVAFGTPSPTAIRPGKVGTVLPGIDVRVAPDGEICLRGPCVFAGYWNDPTATAEVLVDGWLHTGDVGEMDDAGYLRLTDRKKDIIVTAAGKNVAPQPIEDRLREHPGIGHAVVLGDRRRYLVALITLDVDALQRTLGPLPADDITRHPAVRAYVGGVVDRVNAELSRFETIKYFEILGHAFTVENGELTPSLKVKRRVIDERYRHVIDGLYAAA